MIKKVLNKILGDPNEKALKKIRPLVEKIKQIADKYETEIKDQNDVLAKTSEFKKRYQNGESLEDLLPEAFALVKVAIGHLNGTSWEVRGQETKWEIKSPYDVQIIGGIVLHQGNIAEMKTGEGKTLSCTMPVYLNALTEKGVFVVTVNEYLASRDAEWMGGLYNYLGLSVGVTAHGMSHKDKKAAYNCDITYGTNNEFGFDYLRDNMTTDPERVTQKELHYAIIDEVDSILIDEARTPLIISAPAAESTDKYVKYSKLIPNLKEGQDYDIDEKSKTAALSEDGITKMEKLLGINNIYTEAGFSEVHHIEQALRAYACYKADIDYIVKEGTIVIIDQFTGRLMPGRRYSQGLHQAIEAKENVEIKRQSKTLATISFQNYFRMFEKLGGMTGTAKTEAEEFYQIYGLDTIVIPTNRPIARQDNQDSIYKNRKGKYLAATKKIKELNDKGQPVLVGTVSVEQSETLSKLLKLEGVKHDVLNAKNHEREAEIVANAGAKGAVTIATNMAGRGTDIKISDEVKELGGLFVLGTERHESRRIDNQLRGRSGRQGDPGASQFFVSMEDDLMRLFGGERIQNVMNLLKVPEDMPIENRIISGSIESAQKKVEGRNFDIRKHLVEYDDVMNIQRQVIYKKRQEFLMQDDMLEEIQNMMRELAEGLVLNHTEARPQKEWDYKEIYEALSNIVKTEELTQAKLEAITEQEPLIQFAENYLIEAYNERQKILDDAEIQRRIEKVIYLRANDSLWTEHITAMTRLRENVAFSGLAQKNPLTEYKSQGYEMFRELLNMVRSSTINTLFKIDLQQVATMSNFAKSRPQATKTNEDQISAPLSGNPTQTKPAATKTYSSFDAKPDNPAIVKKENKTKSGINVIRVKVDDEDDDQPMGQTNLGPGSTSEPVPQVGRNEPCPCGSGKKYKKCHGAN